MRLPSILGALSAFLWCASATSDGLQDVVTWDQYSLLINDTRVFIYGGEFHYQRMPVPELWLVNYVACSDLTKLIIPGYLPKVQSKWVECCIHLLFLVIPLSLQGRL